MNDRLKMVLLCAVVIGFSGLFAAVGQDGPPATTAAVEAVAVAAAPAPATEPAGAPVGLTIKQRRELGLTLNNLIRVTKQLKRDKKLEGLTHDQIAVVVAEQLVVENPKAAADATIDWDAIIAFIERLIPLIMKIIALFT